MLQKPTVLLISGGLTGTGISVSLSAICSTDFSPHITILAVSVSMVLVHLIVVLTWFPEDSFLSESLIGELSCATGLRGFVDLWDYLDLVL